MDGCVASEAESGWCAGWKAFATSEEPEDRASADGVAAAAAANWFARDRAREEGGQLGGRAEVQKYGEKGCKSVEYWPDETVVYDEEDEAGGAVHPRRVTRTERGENSLGDS